VTKTKDAMAARGWTLTVTIAVIVLVIVAAIDVAGDTAKKGTPELPPSIPIRKAPPPSSFVNLSFTQEAVGRHVLFFASNASDRLLAPRA